MTFSMRQYLIGSEMSSVIDRFAEEGSAASIEKAKLDREAVVAELDALIARHEWFSAARMIRRLVSGEEDEALELVLHARGASSLALTKVDSATLTAMTDDDIIERFLSVGDYRIVAEQDDSDAAPDVALAAVSDADDEYVSEDLAEIYLSQGFYEQAIAIYRQLSLQNSEKSVYFAEIISKIEKKYKQLKINTQ